MTISPVEYMNTVNEIYNISGVNTADEEAAVFTLSLFNYFLNGCKNIYLRSKEDNDEEMMDRAINRVLDYDGGDLSDEERKFRSSIAKHVGLAYLREYYDDATFCAIMIAFIIRHDLHKVVDFIRHQAEKLSISRILYQTHAFSNAFIDEELTRSRSELYYYETKGQQKVLMEVWAGSLFKDDYNRYINGDIKNLKSTFAGRFPVDWFVVYFPNLNVIRVSRNGDDAILKQLPDELLA